MSERHWRSLLLRLGSEMALWYCLPIAFLAVYVTRYAAPAAAILPHLQLIALSLLALAMLRLAGAGCAYIALMVLSFLYLARFDWVPLLARRLSGSILALTAAGSGTVAIGVYEFSAGPWILQRTGTPYR